MERRLRRKLGDLLGRRVGGRPLIGSVAAVHELNPAPDPVDDIAAVIGRDERPRGEGRPWVMANMVASVDGAHSLDGRSAPLSSPADRVTFHAIRAAADVILVAAGTVRAERYGRPRAEPWARRARDDRGQEPAPLLVIVSRSLDLPDDLPLLAGEGPEPLVLHPADADASLLPAGVRSWPVGDHQVDLGSALEQLAADGSPVVLCEGGPRLLGDLVELDLLDELFLTISPRLVGGDRLGLLGPAPEMDRRMELHRVLTEDDALLLTYRRAR